MKKLAVTIVLCVIALLGEAQNLRHSIRGDFKLPSPTGNRAMRATMDGIVDASINYQYPIFKGIGLGTGLNLFYSQVNELSININNNQIAGKMLRWSPYGKLFYEQVFNDKFRLEYAVKGGYSWYQFSSNYCTAKGEVSLGESYFIQPEFGLYIEAQENFTIGLILAYGISGLNYGPANLCMEDFPGFADSDYVGSMQNFSIGFGFAAYLRQGGRR